MPLRNLSSSLLNRILAQKPTLTVLLKLTLKDATELGFTKFPSALVYDGVTYRPGLDLTTLTTSLGFTVDNFETGGYFTEQLTELDAASGKYDSAQYDLMLIDRENLGQGGTVISHGMVREIRCADNMFTVEMADSNQQIQAPVGYLTAGMCQTDVFSSKCGLSVNGTHPTLSLPFKATGVKVTVVGSHFAFQTDLHGFPAQYFTNGKVVWTAGANAGTVSEVKLFRVDVTTSGEFTLQEPPRFGPVAEGDQFTVTWGCNKTYKQCGEVQNRRNMFMAFPHMVGQRKTYTSGQ